MCDDCRPLPSKRRAVIFDIDGTLADSFQLAFSATNKVLTANNYLPVNDGQYHYGSWYSYGRERHACTDTHRQKYTHTAHRHTHAHARTHTHTHIHTHTHSHTHAHTHTHTHTHAHTHTCRQTKEKHNNTHIHKHSTWMKNTHPKQQIIL